MASPSELSLDCKPHSYSMLLKSFGDQQTHDQLQKLEEFLSRLEEERLKIEAFKRELPLCMQLLSNAVETSRQQLQAYKMSNSHNHGTTRPVLEEFIPLKNSSSQELSDKANWMTTAQLWSQANNNNSETKPQPNATLTSPTETDIGFSAKLGLDTKQRNGGAFLPFSKDRNLCPSPTLALANSSDHKDIEDKNCTESSENAMFPCNPKRDHSVVEQNKGVVVNSGTDHAQVTNTNSTNGTTSTTTQTHRKARRCWSPDLHRRFVNALQMLGGSQVATPKQIRELMKVDGLTNDEVKSHLQKYRLHTRRPSPSPQATGAPGTQLVVVGLGGIWVPPEYATAHSAGPTIYHHPASHAPPPHFCAAPPPVIHQDFYAAAAAATPPPPPHHQLNHLHHQLLVYKANSQAQSSPESDNRGTNGGDRSESIEDGKSESSSWKGESVENGVERKGLVALRDEGEESNGSEITLKF